MWPEVKEEPEESDKRRNKLEGGKNNPKQDKTKKKITRVQRSHTASHYSPLMLMQLAEFTTETPQAVLGR